MRHEVLCAWAHSHTEPPGFGEGFGVMISLISKPHEQFYAGLISHEGLVMPYP